MQIEAYAAGAERINGQTGRPCNLNDVLLSALKKVTVDQGIAIRITSLNRWCEGQDASRWWQYHSVNGGGHAVDVDRVNGVLSTGATSQDRVYIQAMIGALPTPAGLGQINCGQQPSVPAGWTRFEDSCNHVHIEYRGADNPVDQNSPPPPPAPKYEIAEISGSQSGWQSAKTGRLIESKVFSAVDMGGVRPSIVSSDTGRLRQTYLNSSGAWVTETSSISLNATSISAVNTGSQWPLIFAVEQQQLWAIWVDNGNWQKQSTGISVTGQISAVVMGSGAPQVMVSQNGTLYQVTASNSGWEMHSTGQPTGDRFDAVNMGGNWPQTFSVMNGQMYQTWGDATGWHTAPLAIAVDPTTSISAVNMGGAWPQVFTVENGLLYRTAVTGTAWSRAWTGIQTAGPADAVPMISRGYEHPLIYTTE